jgi:hypothetical protein
MWNFGIKSLKSFADWALFLFITGLVLGLGYLCGRLFGNPIESIKWNKWVVLCILFIPLIAIIRPMKGSNEALQIKSEDSSKSDPVYGIVLFEMAREKGEAQKIINKWEEKTSLDLRGEAKRQLKLDFLFISIYVVILMYGWFLVSDKADNNLIASSALMLGWAMLFAGILDSIENLALLRMLNHGASASMAALAFWCALPKFVVTLIPIPIVIAFLICYGGKDLFQTS